MSGTDDSRLGRLGAAPYFGTLTVTVNETPPDPSTVAGRKRLEPSDIAPIRQTIDLGSAALSADRDSGPVDIPAGEPPSAGVVQSVDRAIRILEFLAAHPGDARLQDVARHLELNVSTCHHLLQTLAARRFVVRSSKSRRYALGPRVVELARLRASQLDFADEIQPDLERLAAEAGETVCLAVMDRTELVILKALPAPRGGGIVVSADGMQNAAHATALGKAILAWLPETQIARVVAERGLQRFTGKTIASLADLVESLRQTRRHGFAIEDEEFRSGVIGIATAFRDSAGAVIGGIGCALPVARASQSELEAVQHAVDRCAAAISHRFSGLPPYRIALDQATDSQG